MSEKWRVGHATIGKLVEFSSEMPAKYLLPGAKKELCQGEGKWIRPYLTERCNLIVAVQMMVVDVGGCRVAVDTCVGNCKNRAVKAWHMRDGKFLEEMVEAGYPPESFTHVVVTHMHDDHVGWNTVLGKDGEWVPTFPNARYYMVEEELKYWKTSYTPKPSGPMTRAMDDMELLRDSIEPIISRNLLDLVPPTHTILRSPQGVLAYYPTPGHTPGHASVLLTSGTSTALITGDAIHHPIQIPHPEVSATYVDSDSTQAEATRRTLLDFLEKEGTLMIGTHFATPSAGYVVKKEGGGYGFDPVGVKGKL